MKCFFGNRSVYTRTKYKEKTVKKIFITVLLVSLAIFLSMGCVTKQVLRTKYDYRSYNEQIISFYLNPRGDEVIFIGNQYHYIFNRETKAFIELLKNRDILKLEHNNLEISTRVDENTLVYSDIVVRFIDRSLTQKQKSWFQTHSYRQIRGKKTVYIKDYHIAGNRYLSNPNVNAKVERLKHVLEIKIDEAHIKSGDTLRKIVMTPLAVVGDAVLIGGVVVLSPIFLLMNAIN